MEMESNTKQPSIPSRNVILEGNGMMERSNWRIYNKFYINTRIVQIVCQFDNHPDYHNWSIIVQAVDNSPVVEW